MDDKEWWLRREKKKYERKKEMKNEDILGTQMSKCIYTPGIQGGGPPPPKYFGRSPQQVWKENGEMGQDLWKWNKVENLEY